MSGNGSRPGLGSVRCLRNDDAWIVWGTCLRQWRQRRRAMFATTRGSVTPNAAPLRGPGDVKPRGAMLKLLLSYLEPLGISRP
jgi:hypothetical protein